MACCKICCGCADCTEGQEGKCCCGGSGGVCCQPGEYCCSGECQAEPGSSVSIEFGYGIFLSVLPCVEARRDSRAAAADAIEEALTNNGWSGVTRSMAAIRDETSSFPGEPPTYEVECEGCSGHDAETLPISDCYALPDNDLIYARCCGTIDYDNPVSYDDEGQLIAADWPSGQEYDAVIYPCNPLP